MLSQLTRYWRAYAVRGVAAIVLGTAALVWPVPTLEVTVYLFGALAFIGGMALLLALARGGATARRQAWATGLSGLLGIVTSIATLVWPNINALTLLYLVAFWATLSGVLEIVAGIELRRVVHGEFWMILGGALSVVFGSLLALNPGTGLLSLVWLLGFYSITWGCSSLGLGYQLHGIERDAELPVSVNQSVRGVR